MSAAPADWGFATPLDDVSGAIAIAGVGEADHTKASGRTPKEIAAQAIERALADAGLAPGDVDGLMYTPYDGHQFTADDYRAHFGTAHEMWVSTQGGGMVWAGSAPHEAALAIRAARARVVLNVFSVAWATQRAEMVGGPGEVHAQEFFKQNLEVPFGWFPQPVYFATIARRHMHEYGTSVTWTVLAGRGRLFSWSLVHRAFIPQLAGDVPYVAGLVAIDEDPAVRLVSRIVDADPAQLRIDMPVRAVFRPLRFPGVTRTVAAPMFAPLPA